MHRLIPLFALLALIAGAVAIAPGGRVHAQPGPGSGGHTGHGVLASAPQPSAVRIVDFSFTPRDLSV